MIGRSSRAFLFEYLGGIIFMKKYILKRTLFSLLSLVAVILIVLILIYNLMDRNKILRGDETYQKSRYNEREVMRYQIFQKYGYLSYYSAYQSDYYKAASDEEKTKVAKTINSSKEEEQLKNNEILNTIIEDYNSKGYRTVFLPTVYNNKDTILSNAQLLFVMDGNAFERLGLFFANLFSIETVNDVKDPNLTDRYMRWEWDRRSNMPALVGSGTTHKYLIYFDDQFPFIHQNLFHINLGKSHIMADGDDVVEYMNTHIGDTVRRDQIFPKDLDNPDAELRESGYDFHTATYSPLAATPESLNYFNENDHYTVVSNYKSGTTRVGISFILGIIAIFAAYAIGLPIGIWMSQRKDKLVDKIGNLYIIFIMAVPSLAYIYMLATFGHLAFGLPTKYALAEVKWMAFILPTISLALPSIAALMKWMRRFMIDQQNADYVKFARSQGLSEGEIFSKHISKNAFTFLVHGIPFDILGALVGAIITEGVYGVPGIGNMLTESISSSDNSVIVGVTVFYSTLTVLAMILGDVLLAKYDPRISLDGGRS